MYNYLNGSWLFFLLWYSCVWTGTGCALVCVCARGEVTSTVVAEYRRGWLALGEYRGGPVSMGLTVSSYWRGHSEGDAMYILTHCTLYPPLCALVCKVPFWNCLSEIKEINMIITMRINYLRKDCICAVPFYVSFSLSLLNVVHLYKSNEINTYVSMKVSPGLSVKIWKTFWHVTLFITFL